LGKHYDDALIPDEMRRNFDVYDRIRGLGIDLGTFEDNVTSLAGNKIAHTVIQESGLVFMSGASGGIYPMNDDEDRIKHGQIGAQDVADKLILRLHWSLTCGGEGDLNDVLYTVKALGMVVSPGGGATSAAPSVTNGFSARWHSVFGGGLSDFADSGVDPGGFAGVHARSAVGGFDGRFSIEPEIIVAIPSSLAREIIMNRGWVFPLPPAMFTKIKAS
jgi:hypothetical protein